MGATKTSGGRSAPIHGAWRSTHALLAAVSMAASLLAAGCGGGSTSETLTTLTAVSNEAAG